jgi:hypothetical protein
MIPEGKRHISTRRMTREVTVPIPVFSTWIVSARTTEPQTGVKDSKQFIARVICVEDPFRGVGTPSVSEVQDRSICFSVPFRSLCPSSLYT